MTDLNDILALIGLALLSAGLWMLSPPAGLIAPGAALLLVAIWRALHPTKGQGR